MATLKQLVTQTTTIKNNVIARRDKLRTNLSLKNVSSDSTETLDSLIDKVAKIPYVKNAPAWFTGGLTANEITMDENYNATVGDTWISGASNTLRINIASASVDGKIYAFGGNLTSGGFTTNCVCYDPLANTWTSKRALSAARAYIMAATVNGYIYIFGGLGGTSSAYTYSKATEMYSPTSNTWTTKKTMSLARYGAGCSAIGSNIYLCAGMYDPGNGSTMESNGTQCYSTTSDSWSTKSNSTYRTDSKAVTVGNTLYLIGGNMYTSVQSTTNGTTWSTKRSMPTGRSGMGATVKDNKIYVIGGEYQTWKPTNVNEVYDTTSNTWTTKTPLSVAVWGLGAQTIDTCIYTFGGTKNSTSSGTANATNCYIV